MQYIPTINFYYAEKSSICPKQITFNRSGCKKMLEIISIYNFKNSATTTKFIIAIAVLNFLIEMVNLSSLCCNSIKIKAKKLQKSDKFNIIYMGKMPLLIINALIINFYSEYLAK